MKNPMLKDPSSINLLRDLERYERISEDDRIKIPEYEFVEQWLPLLYGSVRDEENMTPIGHWMDVARGPFNEVDVVDPAGEVLFTVPKIFNEFMVVENKNSANSIQNLIIGIEERQQAEPPEVTRMRFKNLLNSRIPIKENEADLETWNNIFTRYGLDPVIFVDDLSKVNTLVDIPKDAPPATVNKDDSTSLDVETSLVEQVIDDDDW